MRDKTPARPRAARSLTVALMAAALAFAAPVPALADKIADKKAEAAKVQAQIDALDTKASIADEAYNQARDRHTALTARAKTAAGRVAQLASRKAALQSVLGVRADAMYRSDESLGMFAALLSSRTFDDFTYTLDLLTKASNRDAATVAQLKQTEADARSAQKTLLTSQAQAAQQEAAMAAAAKTVRDQLAERTKVLGSLDAEVKTLIAEEQARQAALARARYLATLAWQRAHPPSRSSHAGSASAAWLDIGNPPTSSKGAAAVYWAERALGRPYVWAASGPGSFDCSGLTMWAYSHVGVSLPHSSRAQISCGARVSRANLQPGDLVFFYSPIHHVGMYVGGGNFIEAPHSGGVVQISSLARRGGSYVGACRP